jgi:hexosaminidase
MGWAIEIKKYPELTKIENWPPIVPRWRRAYGKCTQGFYTQDDVREIVAYAAARHVTVVPEIEMPGHAQAAIAAYPELGVYPDSQFGVLQWWGVSDVILSPEARTITFMQNVLEEVLALFPSTFIHIGGDEATKTQWEQSPRVQRRMQELGVKDAHELQSWFIRQMDTWLTARGRRLIGWDEILEGGLAPGATVMSWRGMNGGIAAARAGHDVVMAPTSHTYFDYYQSRDRANEPLAIGGFLPLETVYAFEPVPDSLSAAEAAHVLGAQAQHWTEYLPTPRHVEYQAFPRLAALSEVVWSPRAQRSWPHFRGRLDTHLRRLDALAVHYRRPEPLEPGPP